MNSFDYGDPWQERVSSADAAKTAPNVLIHAVFLSIMCAEFPEGLGHDEE